MVPEVNGRPPAKRADLAQPNNASGMSTNFARRYSPSVFACGSSLVDDATPSPSNPWMTKLSAARLGNAKPLDLETPGLRYQPTQPLDCEERIEPAVPGLGARPHAEVGVAPLVPGPGARHQPERGSTCRARRPAARFGHAKWLWPAQACDDGCLNVDHRPAVHDHPLNDRLRGTEVGQYTAYGSESPGGAVIANPG